VAASWNKQLENKMIRAVAIEFIISLSALIVGVLLITLRRRRGIGYASTIAYSVCLSLGGISFFAISHVSNPQVTLVLKIIVAIIIGYLPAFVFTYVLGTIIQSQQLSYRIIFVLAFIPIYLLVVFIVQSVPGFLFSGMESQNFMVISPLDVWGWLMLVYSIGILVATLILTVSTSSDNILKPLKIWPLIAISSAILASIILDSISFTNLVPMITEYDLMLIGFILIGVALLFINLKIPQTNLITRNELFESINDGIIIINNEDKILDLNPAAEQLIGIPTHRAYGDSVEKYLINWNSISGSNDAKKEFRGSINLNKQWHQFDVRINKLDDERGKVIILRDITARMSTDEMRQHAREEMFNLLRSLFTSANTSQSSNDFFRDVLFQITYTFHVESGAICLVDSIPDSRKFIFSVMAKHGALMEDKETLSNLQKALVESKWIFGNKEPLMISDVSKNPQFTKISQKIGDHSIAVFSMVYNEQLMGVLMLARTEVTGFSSDEIVRLGVVTEELASFLYSDRKRKSDIALTERHRLSQDLHDSITQKLYGLVTLTEAVKLGLESGAPVDENGMVEKISDNARQALREMRLFLFELEPVDIERDGLVSTIQQRLDSVEGRSGIQARMNADGEILLSKEKETEIFYIVEEALNNILKHANAKSVLVKLKQRKASIYLEVSDNGCGFDPDIVKFGGKGLGNIKDRATRIKGRLNIVSSPKNGTKITLVVPQ
jgi:PAS domain S-box-containing protein